jgi:hypothetical protein
MSIWRPDRFYPSPKMAMAAPAKSWRTSRWSTERQRASRRYGCRGWILNRRAERFADPVHLPDSGYAANLAGRLVIAG